MIRYEAPANWILYDHGAIATGLVEAKASVVSLSNVPYQRRWVEELQKIELKREVAGTSRIEGAEFTERELDVALRDSAEELQTRSQRQARAAVQTYRWIASLPDDRPVDGDLIREIHRRIVTGADDDRCPPGALRDRDQNVTFGAPRHRGVDGGEPCQVAFEAFTTALRAAYPSHDPLIRALAAHYHLAAMHPFLDGNGRTARALEALLLQRAGLRETSFIAMSNYYYDEKTQYLTALADVRRDGHDLTPFIVFALKGVVQQVRRLLGEIQRHISRELYLSLASELFGRLKSPRKRVIAQRQLEILRRLLEVESVGLQQLMELTEPQYRGLKNPTKAVVRDLSNLFSLKAIKAEKGPSGEYQVSVRLQWPTEITETEFFQSLRELPKAKTLSFLR